MKKIAIIVYNRVNNLYGIGTNVTELESITVQKIRETSMESGRVTFVGGFMDGVVMSLKAPLPATIYRVPNTDEFVEVPGDEEWERYMLMVTASGYFYYENTIKKYAEKQKN
jgi:hypothetical protein